MDTLGVITGEKPLKIDIGIDYMSAAILAAAIFVVGLVLIIINKKI
jgi:hypothetical protein